MPSGQEVDWAYSTDQSMSAGQGGQGSETRVDTQKTWRGFLGGVNPPKNPSNNPAKNPPKFNPVSFLVLLITKDFIMFKALEKS